jgi:hypothetical protein
MCIRRQIFFDGFLPPTKYDTRISRSIVNTKKLANYHKAYPITPCSAAPSQERHDDFGLFSRGSARDSLTQFPPVPFLVPAILEALQQSQRYKPIVRVIPGEADIYCASLVRGTGGIVITSDSDLLVHDLGASGKVVFFRDMEMKKDDRLWAPIFHPVHIAGRLDLPGQRGLQALAFEMILDNNSSLTMLAAQAKVEKSAKLCPDRFDDFKKEYINLPVQLPSAAPVPVTHLYTVQRVLWGLDPRISEFVIQFPFLARVVAQPPCTAIHSSPHIFLPFLHDSPVRTTSWEASRGVRQVAYGILNLVAPHNERISTTFEHIRQETNSSGRELQVPVNDELYGLCWSLVVTFQKLKEKIPNLSQADLWIAVSVIEDIQFSYENSRPNLGQLVKQQVLQLKDKPQKGISWEILHFHAQMQATYYSFRILKQIFGVLTTYSAEEQLSLPIGPLREMLSFLPPLSEVQDISHAIPTIKLIRNMDMVKVAQEILDINLPEPSPKSKMSYREAKRKRKRSRKEQRHTTDSQASNNPFGLLSRGC